MGNINFEQKVENKKREIRTAVGKEKADIVLKNATYFNVFTSEFLNSDIAITNNIIVGIGDTYNGNKEYDMTGKIVVPGFIDGHIHLESSMVSPKEFAKAVVPHGTTTVVTDPHEITNVMGLDGIEYMLQSTSTLPLDVIFMIPSCVPATPMDESGAILGYNEIEKYLDNKRVYGLAEMMNYVGVINSDDDCISKIVKTQENNKAVDGHAPSLSGKDLNGYICSGVYSDHECADIDDALEKLHKGQYIMIREGTAAKNLTALLPLLNEQYSDRCLFATDDKHPSDLLFGGHIDYIIKKAIKGGVDPKIALKVASINAAKYFGFNNKGAIAPGYLADIVVVDNLDDFNIEKVFNSGKLVFDGNMIDFDNPSIDKELNEKANNTFNLDDVTKDNFKNDKELAVIGLIPGEIITENLGLAKDYDIEKDILKIACIERHKHTNHIGLGFVKGYGLKSGAVATSIAHDSHNIITVGTNDEDIAIAVNALKNQNGGIVIVNNGEIISSLQLNIGGLMTDESLSVVNEKLEEAKEKAFSLGVEKGIDPFMTLSFSSLPVIPSLRITTKGIFDVDNWKFL